MNISTYGLKRLIPHVKIIDIRDNYEYNLGNVPTSKNIPKNFLLQNPELYLNKIDRYYIICSYGNTSLKVCDYLLKKGYNVINVLGGYNDYKKI